MCTPDQRQERKVRPDEKEPTTAMQRIDAATPLVRQLAAQISEARMPSAKSVTEEQVK